MVLEFYNEEDGRGVLEEGDETLDGVFEKFKLSNTESKREMAV